MSNFSLGRWTICPKNSPKLPWTNFSCCPKNVSCPKFGGPFPFPAYQEKRSSLLDYLENEYKIKISRMSPNRILMFLINPPSGNVRIKKLIAKHIFECFEKRKGEDGKVNTQGLLNPWVFT